MSITEQRMSITKDVKLFAEMQRDIGYLSGMMALDLKNADFADELANQISEYVTDLFNAKRDGVIAFDFAHDGCDGCKYLHYGVFEDPCVNCCGNYTDKYAPIGYETERREP